MVNFFQKKLCEYGCGRPAKYAPRNKLEKWRCEINSVDCPLIQNRVFNNIVYVANSYHACVYCGEPAHYIFKNRKWCCENAPTKCLSRRTIGCKAWNKGLTKNTDERVRCYSKNMKSTKLIQSSRNEIKAWNKGLTKNTDERVRCYSMKISPSKKGVPNYKKRKPINKITCLTESTFKKRLNSFLYIYWKYPILKRDRFQCSVCNETRNLEVHHLIQNCLIYKESVCLAGLFKPYEEWTIDNLKRVLYYYLELHTIDIGITLCKFCHAEIDEHRRRFII